MPSSAAGSIRLVIATLATGLAIFVLAACGSGSKNSGDAKPARLTGTKPPVAKTAGGLRLPAVGNDGVVRAASFKPAAGNLTLVFFGYTFCPDICPTGLAELRLAIGELSPAERERITTAFVTVDPKRDTFVKLKSYVGGFFDKNRWLAFRTTDRERLARTERAFGAAHTVDRRDGESDYGISHTTHTYAVDEKGEVVLEWLFGTPGSDIADDLRILLDPNKSRSIRTQSPRRTT